ncbi:MAG TPA: hypothetical protein VIM19_20755 [Actinomycetes bacterium]
MAGASLPRHRRTHPWWPAGRHRVRTDPYSRWVVPLVVAAGIMVVVFSLLVVDALVST